MEKRCAFEAESFAWQIVDGYEVCVSTKLEMDKERLREAYRDKGYFTAKVLDEEVNVRKLPAGKFRVPLFYQNKARILADLKIPVEEGRQYKLKVRQIKTAGQSSQVQLVRGQFLVTVPCASNSATRAMAVRNDLVQWYRDKAGEYVPRIAARFSDRLGLRHTTVQIREMKQRWGSAGSNGRVSFNWRIIMAPKRLVEYVIAHELCHLKHNDHSRDFWRLLERTMPDYERRRTEPRPSPALREREKKDHWAQIPSPALQAREQKR